ncbi:B-cell receptor CD22-like [Hoplias malabaricus]|uniref:B-cell receptor CD22-like n=1 Tax=Hoplias malabaricus TaxID=27720 RepID=UPI003462EAD7
MVAAGAQVVKEQRASDTYKDSKHNVQQTGGASGAKWSVTYNQQEICALKGSTVFMNGSYTHPDGLTVTKAFWIIDPIAGGKRSDLSKESDYSGRVEYFTDEQKQYISLKLCNVEKKDEHQYCFMLETNDISQKWLGFPGVPLTVTELHVETPGAVTEGGAAVLKCVTTCSLTDPTFIWYKNGRPLTTKTTINNQLHLQPVSSEDAGSYSCAVNGYQHLPSPDHTLTVRYSPKNISVSISPSGEIVEGSSMTLTCSSDAYPPVENYTWFKNNEEVSGEKGENYTIIKISSKHSGGYQCRATNEYGNNNSTTLHVNVLYPPRYILVFLVRNISYSGEIVEDSSVTLTCSSDANPPVENYTWLIEGGVSPVGSGHSYRPLQSGSYYCEAHNKHGAQRSASIPVFNGDSTGLSVILYIGFGVSLCVNAALLTVVFLRRGKRRNRTPDRAENTYYDNEIYLDPDLGLHPAVEECDLAPGEVFFLTT